MGIRKQLHSHSKRARHNRSFWSTLLCVLNLAGYKRRNRNKLTRLTIVGIIVISKEAAGRMRSNALFAAWLLLTYRVLVEQAQASTRIEWTVEPVFGYHK